MGNECCGAERKERKSAFTEHEKAHLRGLYYRLSESKKNEEKKGFNKTSLYLNMFPENPHLGPAIYKFMKANSGSDNEVDYDTFEASLEVLIKEPGSFQYKQFRDREKVDMLALLMIGDFSYKREALKDIDISYLQAMEFVKYNAEIIQPTDEYTAKVVVDGVFKEDEGHVDWWKFVVYIKENLLYVNRSLKLYFTAKFFEKTVNIQIPRLNQGSYVINKDLLGLLYLSNVSFHSITQLSFLYSSHSIGFSFEELASTLKSYAGPTFFLMKVLSKGTQSSLEGETTSVLGGFTRMRWKDSDVYHGDSDSYLFTLSPKFKNYFASTRTTSDTNFVYLNTKEQGKIGIGFGGSLSTGFRLWIDGKDLKDSYIKDEDHTYENGPLVDKRYDKDVRIEYIEVWGLGTELPIIEETAHIRRYDIANRQSYVVTTTTEKITNVQDNQVAPFSNTFMFEADTQSFIESKFAEVNRERDSFNRKPAGETVKKSGFRGNMDVDILLDNGYFFKAKICNVDSITRNGGGERAKKSGYMGERNSYSGGGSDQWTEAEPKPRSTFTTSYGYYNPFSKEQMNLNITKEADQQHK